MLAFYDVEYWNNFISRQNYIQSILLLVSGCRLILYVKHCGESIGSMMNIIYGLCRKLIFYRMDSAYLLVMIENI